MFACTTCDFAPYLPCPPWAMGTTTFSIMTLSKKGLFVTLSINDTQHNTRYAIMLIVIMLSVMIYVLLCWMSLCLMSLCWMSCRRAMHQNCIIYVCVSLSKVANWASRISLIALQNRRCFGKCKRSFILPISTVDHRSCGSMATFVDEVNQAKKLFNKKWSFCYKTFYDDN